MTPSSCLKVNGKSSDVTSTFPLRAQNIRFDAQVGRMITSQPNSQGNMSATEGRDQAEQFTSHTVQVERGRPCQVDSSFFVAGTSKALAATGHYVRRDQPKQPN